MNDELLTAARDGDLPAVKRLVQSGLVNLDATDAHGNTAVMLAAEFGNHDMLRWLVERGADIGHLNADGKNTWDVLYMYWSDNGILRNMDWNRLSPDDKYTVLRTLLLREGPPGWLVGLMLRVHQQLVEDGVRLRAQLPAYLAERRSLLDTHCPLVAPLPEELRALVYSFEGPATTEELWATGLGAAL